MSPSTRTQTDSRISPTTISHMLPRLQSVPGICIPGLNPETDRQSSGCLSLISPCVPRLNSTPYKWNTLTGLWCQYIKLFARMVTGDIRVLSTSPSQISSMVWTPPCYQDPPPGTSSKMPWLWLQPNKTVGSRVHTWHETHIRGLEKKAQEKYWNYLSFLGLYTDTQGSYFE